MPSLRRTVSESATSVRTSPYPSALSLSAAGALNAGIPTRPRRTGSETSGRRVLADIEWWRILDGQQEEDNDNANVNENDLERVNTLQLGLVETLQESTGEHAAAAAVMDAVDDDTALRVSDASQGASSLTTPFAAMSISPVPPMTPPRSRAASEESTSSVESTPESSPRTPLLRYETLFMDAPAINCTIADADTSIDSCALLPPFVGRPSMLNALPMMRSVSFGGFDAPRESADDRFGDVIFI
ncbi:uncharacterized protein FOMMEDRAFT_18106 [Fomitiporia mediterranea MF3/22]|uniref:uncharacterized protein n=1 Tax=Fomitiporia mediterranea (strain MF3/22) TaxID=694068 RepID=UPI0004409005|nr:uncharacterized protein FOMMEDRAFT_18106 [Fomitiporia mediterranea MF3/22]EJD05864.1 hypothetical protein FOMMEDRAFT_18106 [Fomitiporia mediterranea MF3/22]